VVNCQKENRQMTIGVPDPERVKPWTMSRHNLVPRILYTVAVALVVSCLVFVKGMGKPAV
jgi:hypothetical protein